MKKGIFYLLIGVLFMANYSYVVAQSESSASSASSQKEASASATGTQDKDIENLKERLANKVEEIRKKDQKAVSGFATVKDSKITVKDADDVTYVISVDDALTKLYQISGTTKKEIKAETIKSGAYIIASGPVVDKTVNANTVYVDEAFVVKSGQITSINKANFSFTIMTQDKESVTLDVESGTKQNMLNIKTLEIEATGFSKIKEGDTIHFSASTDAETFSSNRYSAQKILIIPQEYFMK